MKKVYTRTLVLSLIAVVCLGIGIALTVIGAINISKGVNHSSDGDNKNTTPGLNVMSTTTSDGGTTISTGSSRGSSITSTTPTIPPYYYPPRSGIVFGIISGGEIKPEVFEYIVHEMIPNIITTNWTQPQRVGALCYSKYPPNQIVPFNEPDYNTIKKNISSFIWTPKLTNISTELNQIRQSFLRQLPLEDKYMQTVLFTGTSEKEDIEDSIIDSMMLNESGQLIVIGVGRSVDKNLLKKLSNNVLIWYYGGNEKLITSQVEEMIVGFNPISFSTTTTTAPPTTTINKNVTSMTTNSLLTTTSPPPTKVPIIQTTTTTNSPVIYYPCFTDIILAIDTSSDVLSPLQFQEQISLLTIDITSLWTHYERVALTSYNNNFNSLYTFNTIANHTDFTSKINTFTQGEGSSLTRLLSGLLTLETDNSNQLSIFIFISKLNYADLQFAKTYASQLLRKGKLNFIILDNNVNPYDLVSLNASKIVSYNFTKESLPGVKSFFETSYSCNFVPSTPWPLTTTTIQTTTSTLPPTTVSRNYYPPKSGIVFSIDSNKNVDSNLYQSLKTMLTGNIITSQWTYSPRVGVLGYDSNDNTQTSPFGLPNFLTIKEIVNNFTLLSGACSISTGLLETKLQFYTLLPDDLKYMQTVLFTSCSDMNDINNAIVEAFFLREMGQLIIVGFGGNVKKENLLKLTDKVIIWNGDLNDSNFINTLEGWIVGFEPGTFNTSTTSSTTPGGSVAPSKGTKNPITISTLSPNSTSLPPQIPYYPCQTNIILAIDASSDVMTSNDFSQQLNLIQNTITTNWTHYDRVALSWYNGVPSTFFSFNTIGDRTDFNIILKSLITQGPGSSLSKLLSSLVYLQNKNNFKTSTFIFISKVDLDDIEKSREFAENLLKEGYLNFIINGSSITSQQLTMLMTLNPSNIQRWDLSNNNDVLRFFNNSFDC
uniref:VWFA domain-containing protein n=1 Tax=Strongyloides venezuelensis TaxID=75913 RepID=A0A0K0F370_STRVS